MKLLVVEDKLTELQIIRDFVNQIQSIQADFALSRDSALKQIDSIEYDLAILDLQIPPDDGSLSTDINHGMMVLEHLQKIQPWISIYFFSAFGTVSRVSDLLDNNRKEDLFGSGQCHSMIRFIQKTDLSECTKAIQKYSEELSTLDEIKVLDTTNTDLSVEHKRLLQIFARGFRGERVEAQILTGGKSGAKTMKVNVIDNAGSVKSVAIAKLANYALIQEELEGFSQHVSPILPIGSFAHHIRSITVGARSNGGNFFGLASQYQQNIYELLLVDESKACEAVSQLSAFEKDWLTNAPKRRLSVGTLRRTYITDEKFATYRDRFEKDWLDEMEEREFETVWCPQHGDMHGFNILVDDNSVPLLIDYGQTKPAPASFDPLSLELSIWFHPDAAFLRQDLLVQPDFDSWANLPEYKKSVTYTRFTEHCRNWSIASSENDPVSTFVMAFAFSCRQLKHPKTEKNSAIRVAISALKQAQILGL